MKKITPSGTRTFCTSRPLGRIDEEITSPIGSGRAATSSSALPMAAMPGGGELQAVDLGLAQARSRGRPPGRGDWPRSGPPRPRPASRAAAEPLSASAPAGLGQVGGGRLGPPGQVETILVQIVHHGTGPRGHSPLVAGPLAELYGESPRKYPRSRPASQRRFPVAGCCEQRLRITK